MQGIVVSVGQRTRIRSLFAGGGPVRMNSRRQNASGPSTGWTGWLAPSPMPGWAEPVALADVPVSWPAQSNERGARAAESPARSPLMESSEGRTANG